MYKRILVAIENSAADQTILAHVTGLRAPDRRGAAAGARRRRVCRAALRRPEARANPKRMKADRGYLEGLQRELTAQGLKVEFELGQRRLRRPS